MQVRGQVACAILLTPFLTLGVTGTTSAQLGAAAAAHPWRPPLGGSGLFSRKPPRRPHRHPESSVAFPLLTARATPSRPQERLMTPEPIHANEEEVFRRVQCEFLEMPGLRLTKPQARRLWGLDTTSCDALL